MPLGQARELCRNERQGRYAVRTDKGAMPYRSATLVKKKAPRIMPVELTIYFNWIFGEEEKPRKIL